MENTPENKARFFALYYGQEVAVFTTTHGTEMLPDVVSNVTIKISPHWHLSLRSIESLTDEELINVANLVLWEDNPYSKIDLIRYAKQVLKSVISNNVPIYKAVAIADYLRSIGVLIPFMGLSCEEIINFGWAKIKE